MNYINDLWNTKSGSVWIIGSDPTLDDYPADFMDNKEGIALHLAYVKFKTEFTYANEPDRVKYLKTIPGYDDTVHLYGFPFCHTSEQDSQALHSDKTYVLNLRGYPPRGDIHDALTPIGQMCLRAMVWLWRYNQTNFFGDFGTCLHGAIFAALMMGYNEINVIGAGMTTIGTANHFKDAQPLDAQQRPGNPDFSKNAHDERLTSTKVILDECEKVGVKTSWYRTYEEASAPRS